MTAYLELRRDGTLQVPQAASPEVYRIPAAIDLFCRRGATSTQALASLGASGGYGLLALEPQGSPEAVDNSSLALQRIQHQTGSGAILWPLASAWRCQGTMADLGLMSRGGESLFLLPGELDSGRLRQLFRYASAFPCRIALTPSEGSLCQGGQINEGAASDRLGLKGLPAVAEVLGVQRAIALAGEWPVALHLRGLSCRGSLEALAEGRRRGLDITCDVALANLLFHDGLYSADLENCPKPWPPLRSADDRRALWEALGNGAINAIVSGYSPRRADDLALPFEEIPFGSETMAETIPTLMDCWDRLGRPVAVERLLSCLSLGPRAILGREVPGYSLIFRGDRGWECRYQEE